MLGDAVPKLFARRPIQTPVDRKRQDDCARERVRRDGRELRKALQKGDDMADGIRVFGWSHERGSQHSAQWGDLGSQEPDGPLGDNQYPR